MKRTIASILVLSSILLCMGCSAPTAVPAAPSLPAARYDNRFYSITRTDGQCYLTPTPELLEYDAEYRAQLAASDICARRALNVPKYSTVAKMREGFLNGSMTIDQANTIRRICTSPDGTAPILDPDRLYEFTLPDDTAPKDGVTLYGHRYSVSFSNDFASGYIECQENTYHTEHDNAKYLDFLSNENITVHRKETVSDRFATVYHASTSVSKLMFICYELHAGDKHMYIQESYCIENTSPLAQISTTIPYHIEIWGTDAQGSFYCSVPSLKERPSIQWLIGFGLSPLEMTDDSAV